MSDIDLEALITDIVDYPKPGVVFKDITTLLRDPEGFCKTIDRIVERYKDAGITKVVGAEARGFMIAAPVAYALRAGFVPARKPGKLPRNTFEQEYDLEYGSDTLQVHADDIGPDDVVLLVDDLIATGGTVAAQVKMLKNIGCTIAGLAFVMELDFLNPRELVAQETDVEIFSLIHVAE